MTRSQYLVIKNNASTREVMKELIAEVVSVGSAAGIDMPDAEQLMDAALRLGDASENLPAIPVIHLHNYIVQDHDQSWPE